MQIKILATQYLAGKSLISKFPNQTNRKMQIKIFLNVFPAFLRHWFSWFLFFMRFSSPSSLTRSMLFSYNTIYVTHFIFFLCKFSNDLHFILSEVFHCNLPLFLDFFHCLQGEVHFLFFVYHSPGTMLLKAFLALLVFYSSIWSLFYLFIFFILCFPSLTFCIHLVFFVLNFVGVQASLFLYYGFPLILFFVFGTIFCKIFSSLLIFCIYVPNPNG